MSRVLRTETQHGALWGGQALQGSPTLPQLPGTDWGHGPILRGAGLLWDEQGWLWGGGTDSAPEQQHAVTCMMPW